MRSSSFPSRAVRYCYTSRAVRSTPLPADRDIYADVPVLDSLPQGGRVLGDFKISADFAFTLKALQSMARAERADAIVIQKINWWDVRSWSDPKTVYRDEVTVPSDADRRDYQQKLREYEEAKKRGKAAEKPSEPKVSHSSKTVSVPGGWNVSGGASVDALLIEWNPARGSARR